MKKREKKLLDDAKNHAFKNFSPFEMNEIAMYKLLQIIVQNVSWDDFEDRDKSGDEMNVMIYPKAQIIDRLNKLLDNLLVTPWQYKLLVKNMKQLNEQWTQPASYLQIIYQLIKKMLYHKYIYNYWQVRIIQRCMKSSISLIIISFLLNIF